MSDKTLLILETLTALANGVNPITGEILEKNSVYKGLFPIFQFVNANQKGPTARAEEFPLYAFLAGKMAKITSIDLIVCGKILSFLSFIFLLKIYLLLI